MGIRVKTFFRYSILVLFFIIQVLFLLAIFRENINSYLLLIFIASIGILMLYTYKKSELHQASHEFESYRIAMWVPIGSICSFVLNHHYGLGPVIGAAIVGLISSFIPHFNKRSHYLSQLPPALYCGAFVGMSSTRVAQDFTFVLTAGVFTAVLLIVSKSLFQGIGGKLGTLAFLGVVLTYFILYLLR